MQQSSQSVPPACVPPITSVAVAPDVQPHHRDPAWWSERLGAHADRVLVDREDAPHITSVTDRDRWTWRNPLVDTWGDDEADAVHAARMASYQAALSAGELLEAKPGMLSEAHAIATRAVSVNESRIMVEEATVHCVPLTTGMYKPPVDRNFDRNQCSSLHPGESVRVLKHDATSGWFYVHSGYVGGWIFSPTMTPPLGARQAQRLIESTPLVPLRDDVRTAGGYAMRIGTSLPIVGRVEGGRDFRVLRPTPEGMVTDIVSETAPVHEGRPPLTLRTFFEIAMSELDEPYGWGGRAGHRDCSQLLRDVFATFGIQLPRHSADQAHVATASISVEGLSETQKRQIIEKSAQRGLVVLYMPGHIMVYLGRDGENDYAVSAISEYVTPCGGSDERVWRLDRVAVTTLELGRGTSRTSFIERITRLAVFAPQDASDGEMAVSQPHPRDRTKRRMQPRSKH